MPGRLVAFHPPPTPNPFLILAFRSRSNNVPLPPPPFTGWFPLSITLFSFLRRHNLDLSLACLLCSCYFHRGKYLFWHPLPARTFLGEYDFDFFVCASGWSWRCVKFSFLLRSPIPAIEFADAEGIRCCCCCPSNPAFWAFFSRLLYVKVWQSDLPRGFCAANIEQVGSENHGACVIFLPSGR